VQSHNGTHLHLVSHGDGAGCSVNTEDAADHVIGGGITIALRIVGDAEVQATHGQRLVIGVERGDNLAQAIERGSAGEGLDRIALRRCHRHRITDGAAALADHRAYW